MDIIRYKNYLIKISKNNILNTYNFAILRLDGFLIEDYEEKYSFSSEKEAINNAQIIIEGF